MLPLLQDGREHCVLPYGASVVVVVRHVANWRLLLVYFTYPVYITGMLTGVDMSVQPFQVPLS